MEFPQRTAHQGQAASPAPAAVNNRSKKSDGPKWLKWVSFALLVSVSVVLAGSVLMMATSKNETGESKYVTTGKYQAVFLNGGQVYFGQVTSLNNSYLRLQDIYYLRVNQTVQPDQNATSQQSTQNDVSLVKLGCELHGPQDEMLINREQIIFWENLKEDGQVAKAVAEYQKQNPDGQKCQTATTPSTTNNDGN
jgi:cyclophilin family peptidyl-prolyl cis-trans isomerase